VVDRNYSIVFMNMSLVKNYGNLTDLIFYREILGMDNPLKLKSITEIIDLQKDTAELETEDRKGNLLRIKASKLVNPDKSLSVILMIEDITLTKRQQDEIYSQKKLLQAERDALNKAAIVAETDLNGKILFVNDKFVEISGHTRKELMGKTHKIINSGFHDKKFFKGLWDTLKAGKVWAGDIKNKRKDGSSYWTRSAMAPVKDRNGKPIKYIAVRFDISEFKK